jgi:co-chaperonin GroES (HSP10)
MKIKAIRNHIIFEFLDGLNSQNQFTQTTESGIHVAGHFDASAKEPRWARILAVGPDVDDDLRAPNCEILIENLRWTEGVVYQGKKYWRTDENQVLACRYPE